MTSIPPWVYCPLCRERCLQPGEPGVPVWRCWRCELSIRLSAAQVLAAIERPVPGPVADGSNGTGRHAFPEVAADG
jgi:hypothetical protein